MGDFRLVLAPQTVREVVRWAERKGGAWDETIKTFLVTADFDMALDAILHMRKERGQMNGYINYEARDDEPLTPSGGGDGCEEILQFLIIFWMFWMAVFFVIYLISRLLM